MIVIGDSIAIHFMTAHVIDAAVHDSRGIHDVRFARVMGWSCSCGQPACLHVSAIRALTEEED